MLVANGAWLIVTNGDTGIQGDFCKALRNYDGDERQVPRRRISFSAGERSTGALTINDGTVALNGLLDIGLGEQVRQLYP